MLSATQTSRTKLVLSWWHQPVIPLRSGLLDCVGRHGLWPSKFILLKFTADVWPPASRPLSINSDTTADLKSFNLTCPPQSAEFLWNGAPTQCVRDSVIDPIPLLHNVLPTRWNSPFHEGPLSHPKFSPTFAIILKATSLESRKAPPSEHTFRYLTLSCQLAQAQALFLKARRDLICLAEGISELSHGSTGFKPAAKKSTGCSVWGIAFTHMTAAAPVSPNNGREGSYITQDDFLLY